MESAIPPSYEEATTSDPWAIIAGYIASADLCAASLVSRKWNETFSPYLWGNPARHFGTENDRVYVALTRFKRTLPTARFEVRQLTHTLHLPPALSEIYDGPKAEWLRDVLDYLPSLQSLLVSELPFFDHPALVAMRSSQNSSTDLEAQTYPLRLLIGTKCPNTTSIGLAEALACWPCLTFLDFSYVTPARDIRVFAALRSMPGLRILKLRHVGLRDKDMELLAEAIGLKIRSLDVCDNRLTDISIRSLLTHCFHSTTDVHTELRQAHLARLADEDWPTNIPRVDIRVMDEFRGDHLDERFVKKLTKGVVGPLPSEDLPHTGITHLYIADNFITMEGIASLLRTENLHVLDAGNIDTGKALRRQRPRSISAPSDLKLPGAEKLTPVLEQHSGKNLTSIRIHHAVVTAPAPPKDELAPLVELASVQVTAAAFRPELDATNNSRHEMDPSNGLSAELETDLPVYELPAEGPAPRYELPAEPVQNATPDSPEPRQDAPEVVVPEPRRGSIFAPEVVRPGEDVVLTASGFVQTDDQATPASPITEPTNSKSRQIETRDEVDVADRTKSSIARIEARRHALRHGVRDEQRGIMPGLVPSLHTLVLTGIPANESFKGTVVDALKSYISDCALESHLASSQAQLEHPSLPMFGTPQANYQKRRSREIFNLRQIILEMAPEPNLSLRPRSTSNHGTPPPGSPATPPPSSLFARSAFDQRNRSSTGDPDTETFWNAQEDDFTFFGEEECGLPAREPVLHVPQSLLNHKMAVIFSEDDNDSLKTPSPRLGPSSVPLQEVEPSKSVVAELANWRAERKALAQRFAGSSGFVEGFWPGEIKIVRPGNGKNGHVDWYGNYFEKSYYYP